MKKRPIECSTDGEVQFPMAVPEIYAWPEEAADAEQAAEQFAEALSDGEAQPWGGIVITDDGGTVQRWEVMPSVSWIAEEVEPAPEISKGAWPDAGRR